MFHSLCTAVVLHVARAEGNAGEGGGGGKGLGREGLTKGARDEGNTRTRKGKKSLRSLGWCGVSQKPAALMRLSRSKGGRVRGKKKKCFVVSSVSFLLLNVYGTVQ